ncbi:MAG: hypothetical protein EAY75_11610 [Bacteroidetes bacterium]|nr:MAG: hypothetical protein EAY75_11610 [Bacteroidota bacterium]
MGSSASLGLGVAGCLCTGPHLGSLVGFTCACISYLRALLVRGCIPMLTASPISGVLYHQQQHAHWAYLKLP